MYTKFKKYWLKIKDAKNEEKTIYACIHIY